MKEKKVVSLFSGCGGMDLGFEGGFEVLTRSLNNQINPDWDLPSSNDNWSLLKPTSFRNVFACDILPAAKSAYVPYFTRKGHMNETFHVESIVDLVKQEKNNPRSVFPSGIDLVTGGFPCNDFSVSGLRKGFSSHKSHKDKKIKDDENPTIENRGMLYMWMREVVDLLRPKMFIAENVKGLVSLSDAKSIIEDDFSSIGTDGYLVVDAKVLHSGNYGVPQTRERVFFIGFLKNALKKRALNNLEKDVIDPEYDPYPKQTHFINKESQSDLFSDDGKLKKFVSVGEAFEGLKEPSFSDDPSQQIYSKAKFMGRHCQGQTEIKLDSLGPTIRAEHHGNIEFRRLIKKNGGSINHELRKGLKQRRLTLRECARIQTFPDDYEFVRAACKNKEYLLSGSKGYKLIGNAVPPLLAYHIAKRIEHNWNLYFKS